MKRSAPLLLAFSVCLWAADFWQSKPFTEWSDKELQKMETNSPWSKQISISMGGGGAEGGRGKRGGSGDMDSTLGSGGGAGQHGQVQDLSGGATGGSSMILTVSWRTALPVRQAVAKVKYGAEATTSPDARKLVEENEKYYGILVSGLPGGSGRGGEKMGSERMKDALLKSTTLNVKGKDAIQVADIQTGGNEQKPVVLFLFPRTAPLTVDDKDVEFSTRLGPMIVRQKFHLKDMVFNGKLEL